MSLYEHLVRRALVHERSDKLTGGKVEHEAERYRDWKRGQRLAEYCQQQQGETETLKTHTYITQGVHTHTHIHLLTSMDQQRFVNTSFCYFLNTGTLFRHFLPVQLFFVVVVLGMVRYTRV